MQSLFLLFVCLFVFLFGTDLRSVLTVVERYTKSVLAICCTSGQLGKCSHCSSVSTHSISSVYSTSASKAKH